MMIWPQVSMLNGGMEISGVAPGIGVGGGATDVVVVVVAVVVAVVVVVVVVRGGEEAGGELVQLLAPRAAMSTAPANAVRGCTHHF